MRVVERKIGIDDCCIIHLIVNGCHRLARVFTVGSAPAWQESLARHFTFSVGRFWHSARKAPHKHEKDRVPKGSARLQPAHQQIKELLCQIISTPRAAGRVPLIGPVQQR